MQTVVDYSVYLAIRAAICIVQALSLETCQTLARSAGWFMWHVVPLRRRVIAENLEIAFPRLTPVQRADLAVQMWEHLFLMVAEIAHAPRKVHRTNWRRHSAIPELPTIVRRLIDRRPLVIVSGHLGNFEMGGYLLGLHGFATHTIARALDNRFLDQWVTEFRGATGQYMLPKFGSSREISELLQRGGALVLLGDQHAGSSACWVDFFGKRASTHKAVAVFTLSAVCGVLRRGKPLQFELRAADAIDPRDSAFDRPSVRQITQWYTSALEDLIRETPQQYWWVHRRWKGSPEDARARRRARRARAA